MKTIGRFNKGEAISAVRRLLDGYALQEYEIESLLNHLLPVLPGAARNAWEFVVSAMGVKDIREYINYVHVIDEVAYATDGHRLHFAPAVEMADGIYNEKKFRLPELDGLLKPVAFFRAVTPACTGSQWSKVSGYAVELFGDGTKTQRLARMDRVGERYRINLSYLLDATAGDADALYAVSESRDDIIRINNKLGEAVIIGVRV